MKFNRTKGIKELKASLENEELYIKHLKDDKDVFMAFRKNYIDFYYSGANIFSYSREGFTSHKKYCFNPNINVKDYYINIRELESIKPITDIASNYKLIKELGKKYAGVEGEGVSHLYRYKFNNNKQQDFILIDTEIALYDADKKDRIDLLIYDIKNGVLHFVEAKDFYNKELWSSEGTKPKVISQIERYKEKISKYHEEILNEYKAYVKLIDESLKEPQSLSYDVPLYMFGFDANQKNKINKLLKDDESLDEVTHYFIGNPKEATPEKIITQSVNTKKEKKC